MNLILPKISIWVKDALLKDGTRIMITSLSHKDLLYFFPQMMVFDLACLLLLPGHIYQIN